MNCAQKITGTDRPKLPVVFVAHGCYQLGPEPPQTAEAAGLVLTSVCGWRSPLSLALGGLGKCVEMEEVGKEKGPGLGSRWQSPKPVVDLL